jgi:organic radical activating enzyme
MKKLQDLLSNEKANEILHSMNRKETKEISPTMKREKIRSLLKENKNLNKEKAKKMIENFRSAKEKHEHEVITKEKINQQNSFKQRLEKKKIFRATTQPMIKIVERLNPTMNKLQLNNLSSNACHCLVRVLI